MDPFPYIKGEVFRRAGLSVRAVAAWMLHDGVARQLNIDNSAIRMLSNSMRKTNFGDVMVRLL